MSPPGPQPPLPGHLVRAVCCLRGAEVAFKLHASAEADEEARAILSAGLHLWAVSSAALAEACKDARLVRQLGLTARQAARRGIPATVTDGQPFTSQTASILSAVFPGMEPWAVLLAPASSASTPLKDSTNSAAPAAGASRSAATSSKPRKAAASAPEASAAAGASSTAADGQTQAPANGSGTSGDINAFLDGLLGGAAVPPAAAQPAAAEAAPAPAPIAAAAAPADSAGGSQAAFLQQLLGAGGPTPAAAVAPGSSTQAAGSRAPPPPAQQPQAPVLGQGDFMQQLLALPQPTPPAAALTAPSEAAVGSALPSAARQAPAGGDGFLHQLLAPRQPPLPAAAAELPSRAAAAGSAQPLPGPTAADQPQASQSDFQQQLLSPGESSLPPAAAAAAATGEAAAPGARPAPAGQPASHDDFLQQLLASARPEAKPQAAGAPAEPASLGQAAAAAAPQQPAALAQPGAGGDAFLQQLLAPSSAAAALARAATSAAAAVQPAASPEPEAPEPEAREPAAEAGGGAPELDELLQGLLCTDARQGSTAPTQPPAPPEAPAAEFRFAAAWEAARAHRAAAPPPPRAAPSPAAAPLPPPPPAAAPLPLPPAAPQLQLSQPAGPPPAPAAAEAGDGWGDDLPIMRPVAARAPAAAAPAVGQPDADDAEGAVAAPARLKDSASQRSLALAQPRLLFTCAECQFACASTAAFLQHKQERHRGEVQERRIVCRLCGLWTHSLETFRTHLEGQKHAAAERSQQYMRALTETSPAELPNRAPQPEGRRPAHGLPPVSGESVTEGREREIYLTQNLVHALHNTPGGQGAIVGEGRGGGGGGGGGWGPRPPRPPRHRATPRLPGAGEDSGYSSADQDNGRQQRFTAAEAAWNAHGRRPEWQPPHAQPRHAAESAVAVPPQHPRPRGYLGEPQRQLAAPPPGRPTQAQAQPQPQAREVPAMFICPLTQRVMEEPVTLGDGHTYEHAAIVEYLQQYGRSPLTGMAMPPQSAVLAPNHVVRQAIAASGFV